MQRFQRDCGDVVESYEPDPKSRACDFGLWFDEYVPACAATFTAFCAEDLRDGADVVDEAGGVALFCALGDAGGAGPAFGAKFLNGGGI